MVYSRKQRYRYCVVQLSAPIKTRLMRGVIIRLKILLAVTLLLCISVSLAFAQDTAPEAPTPAPTPSPDVQIEASDGRKLYGTYYDNGGDGPAVLLLHQLYTNRSSWTPLQLDAAGRAAAREWLQGAGDRPARVWANPRQHQLDPGPG